MLTAELVGRKLRCPRNMLHLHLFVSFITRAFMALLKDLLFVGGVGLRMDVVEKNGSSYFYDQVSQKEVTFNQSTLPKPKNSNINSFGPWQ
jgi:hypothetical protein